MSIDEWIEKEKRTCVCILHTHIYMHICMYIFFSHKKTTFAICDNMDGAWGHYAKWNKSEKDKVDKIGEGGQMYKLPVVK